MAEKDLLDRLEELGLAKLIVGVNGEPTPWPSDQRPHYLLLPVTLLIPDAGDLPLGKFIDRIAEMATKNGDESA